MLGGESDHKDGAMRLQTLKPRLNKLAHRLPTQTTETQRARGTTGMKRRAGFLQSRPLCDECDREGKTTLATIADHKTPLWAGGADSLDANGNPLCTSHHDAKSACEAAMRAAGGWMAKPCSCGQHRD